MKLSKVPAFGFIKEKQIIGSEKVTHSMALSHNLRKTLGYIPGFSLIQGIEHLVRAMQDKKGYSSHFIFRSIIEVLGLGFLLLIPDIIVTCIRQHKNHSASLQPRKIVPIAPQQTVANPAFPVQVETFVRPVKDPKPADPKVDLIKKQIKKLSEQKQTHKIDSFIERIQLDLTNKTSIESLKQCALEEPKAAFELVRSLYIRGALFDSIEDVEFYKNVGLKLIENKLSASKFFACLNLDLTKTHCLDAVTAIAMEDAKSNVVFSISDYGINGVTNGQKMALNKIANTAVKYNPYSTTQKLPEYKVVKMLAYEKGSLEERKEAAIQLAKHSVSSLMKNWPYFDFNLSDPKEMQAVKEIALAAFLAYPKTTLMRFGAPMNSPIVTPEGLAFWRGFAIDVAKQNWLLTGLLIEELGLSTNVPEQKTVLREIGMACFQKQPWAMLQKAPQFGLEATEVQNEIEKLRQSSLAYKEALLKNVLSQFPNVFFETCSLILNNSPEETTLKKELSIELAQKDLSLMNGTHFDIETLKEIILAATSAIPPTGSHVMLNKAALDRLGLKKIYDEKFFVSLACIMAKKNPATLASFADLFDPLDPIDFATLRDMGLSLAALDGGKFKTYWKSLGFDLNNKQHTDALKEMIALAIADDGDKNLGELAALVPAPDKQELTLKQACSLIAVHANDVDFEPKKLLVFVPEGELQSEEGGKQLLQSLAQAALKSDATAKKIYNFLPQKLKKAGALILVAHLKRADDIRFYIGSYAYEAESLRDLLLEYRKHVGTQGLVQLAEMIDFYYWQEQEASLLVLKEIVKLAPYVIAELTYPSEDDKKMLQGIAQKPGTPEERLAAALEEASFPDAPILKSLPYYHLSDATPVIIKNFSVNPEPYLEVWNMQDAAEWAETKEIILKGAMEMDLDLLLKTLLDLLTWQKYQKIADANFPFELAKIAAAKSIKKFSYGVFGLTETQQWAEIAKIGYKENQSYVLNNLNIFAPKTEREKLKKELAKIKVEGTLEERAKQAVEAIKRGHQDFLKNLKHYFSDEEIVNKKIPLEVAQAYLNASRHTYNLIEFGVVNHDQIEKMVLKAAQEAPNSYELLNIEHLKVSLNLYPHLPNDRKVLFKFLLTVADRYPCEALQAKLFEPNIDFPEELAFYSTLLKKVAEKDADMALETVKAYKWNFTKPEQIEALTGILKAIVKEKELESFPFTVDTWKIEKLQHAIWS